MERATRRALGLRSLAGLMALAACTACTGSSQGPRLSASEAASLAAQGSTRGAVPSAGPTSPGSSTAPSAEVGPQIARNAPSSCKPQDFVSQANLAGGAIETYLTKPMAAGTLSGGAVPTAGKAAAFAATRLRSASTAVQTCHASTALASVTGQTAEVLSAAAKELQAGKVTSARITAAGAMFANVVSQADRVQLTLEPKAPSRSALG